VKQTIKEALAKGADARFTLRMIILHSSIRWIGEIVGRGHQTAKA